MCVAMRILVAYAFCLCLWCRSVNGHRVPLEQSPFDEDTGVDAEAEVLVSSLYDSHHVPMNIDGSCVLRAMTLCQADPFKRANLLLYVTDAKKYVDGHLIGRNYLSLSEPRPEHIPHIAHGNKEWCVAQFAIQLADPMEPGTSGWRTLLYNQPSNEHMGFWFRLGGTALDWQGIDSWYGFRTDMILVYDDSSVNARFDPPPSMADIALVWKRDVNEMVGHNADIRRNAIRERQEEEEEEPVEPEELYGTEDDSNNL